MYASSVSFVVRGVSLFFPRPIVGSWRDTLSAGRTLLDAQDLVYLATPFRSTSVYCDSSSIFICYQRCFIDTHTHYNIYGGAVCPTPVSRPTSAVSVPPPLQVSQ